MTQESTIPEELLALLKRGEVAMPRFRCKIIDVAEQYLRENNDDWNYCEIAKIRKKWLNLLIRPGAPGVDQRSYSTKGTIVSFSRYFVARRGRLPAVED